MLLRLTPALQQLLRQAASDETLPQDLRAAAGQVATDTASTVAWDTVKAIAQHMRQQKGPEAVPPIDQLCRGSGIAYPEPPPRKQGKSPELQAHLDKLRARLEQQQYDKMVHDVTQEERKAAALREGALSTYKQQISFGIHVLAMMAAFYAFGHVAGMALTNNKTVHPLMGLLFMVFALVVETTLFIIRTTVPPKLHLEAARKAQAARLDRQAERQRQELAAEAAAAAGGASGGQQAADRQPPAGQAQGKTAAEKKED